MRLALNVPDFIEEIETQPAIWNSNLEIHSNKIERRYAWENVSIRFCENFLEQSVAERNIIILQFQRKWKSLRDSYSRELLRQKEEAETENFDSNRKQYMYFEKLSFLQAVTKIPADFKTEELLSEEQSIEIDTSNNSNTLSTTSSSSSQEATNICGTKKLANKRLALSKKYKMSAIQTKKLPRKTKKENKPKEDDEPDEDRLFMLSLVPELQKVPDSFKLEIKTELLNVFKKTKMQYNNPQPTNVLTTQQPPITQSLPNVNQFLPNCNLQMSQQQQQQQQHHDNNFNNIVQRTPQYIQQQPMQSGGPMPPMQCISTQSHGHAPPPPYVSQPYMYHHPPDINHQQNIICNNKVDSH